MLNVKEAIIKTLKTTEKKSYKIRNNENYNINGGSEERKTEIGCKNIY